MKFFQRRAALLLVLLSALTLAVGPAVLLAQDAEAQDNDTTDAVTVTGSGIVGRVFDALYTASGAEINLDVQTTGTNAGLQSFCASTADIALANRPLNADEEANCDLNEVEFIEMVIANDVLAFITHPDNANVECISDFDLATLLAPSASGNTMDWGDISGDIEVPLSVYLPPANTPVFAYLDRVVSGDGARNDATVAADDAAVIAGVAETPGAFGVVAFSSLTGESADGVKVLQINNFELGTCYSPSAETSENQSYLAGERLFMYVDADSLSKAGVSDVLNFIAGEEAGAVVMTAGFTPPSEAAYTQMRDVLSNTTTGRVFTREILSFSIPDALSGAVTVHGGSFAQSYIEQLTATLQGNYPGLTVTPELKGEPEGIRGLCNGEYNLVVTQSSLTDEQLTNCTANSVTPLTFDLGAETVVLLSSTSSDYLTCLTTEQIAAVVREQSAGEGDAEGDAETEGVEALESTWNQINGEFPEDQTLLFAPSATDRSSDLLTAKVAGQALPIRSDAEISGDPLYRAAATANVKGALTYMSWSQYQSVLDNEQANIQLVGVDAGGGCVTPSLETVADGSYPLTRAAKLIVNKSALTDIAVQSWLWSVYSDANYELLTSAGFVGVSFDSLTEIRNQLQTAFDEAAAEALEAVAPEPTAEATVEGGEATPEATVEAPTEAATAEPTTEEPTVEPTLEATLEPTVEPTIEATAEPTSEPTVAPTEAPTEEPTAEPTVAPTATAG